MVFLIVAWYIGRESQAHHFLIKIGRIPLVRANHLSFPCQMSFWIWLKKEGGLYRVLRWQGKEKWGVLNENDVKWKRGNICNFNIHMSFLLCANMVKVFYGNFDRVSSQEDKADVILIVNRFSALCLLYMFRRRKFLTRHDGGEVLGDENIIFIFFK